MILLFLYLFAVFYSFYFVEVGAEPSVTLVLILVIDSAVCAKFLSKWCVRMKKWDEECEISKKEMYWSSFFVTLCSINIYL